MTLRAYIALICFSLVSFKTVGQKVDQFPDSTVVTGIWVLSLKASGNGESQIPDCRDTLRFYPKGKFEHSECGGYSTGTYHIIPCAHIDSALTVIESPTYMKNNIGQEIYDIGQDVPVDMIYDLGETHVTVLSAKHDTIVISVYDELGFPRRIFERIN